MREREREREREGEMVHGTRGGLSKEATWNHSRSHWGRGRVRGANLCEQNNGAGTNDTIEIENVVQRPAPIVVAFLHLWFLVVIMCFKLGRGVGLGWDRASHRRGLQASASFPARHWSQILAVRFQGRAD